MRNSTNLKTLFRSPLKTILTFFLIGAASFAFFSRVTDYAITMREASKAESFYSGVAALDNSVPPMGYYDPEPKPWPEDAQMEELLSLPGVTLADTRYTTDGLVEDYKRVIDDDSSFNEGIFVAEGIYSGFEEYGGEEDLRLYLLFDDVKIHAGEINLDFCKPMKVQAIYYGHGRHTYPRSFFDGLKEGSKCLVVGTYSEKTGTAFELGAFSYMGDQVEFLRVIDGVKDDYLETEEFAWYKERIEATKQSNLAYDIVYTADMRAIPYVNEHRLAISEGRPLTTGDTDVCVVSDLFLETYGLSVGDKLHIELGDRLLPRLGIGGTRFRRAESMSDFIDSAEVGIIGAYRFTDSGKERYMDNGEWSYGPATIFVPSSLLPVEVPQDHKISRGDYSIFIENPQDIDAFREAAEPLVAEMGLGFRFSDGGWSGMEDSFAAGPSASLLTTVLYVVGAALALFLAVYLYMGRNKKPYAIMRTLGVSGRRAGNFVVLPFLLLSVSAILAGGMAGLFYASYTAAKTLAGMSVSSAPDGYVYVLDAAIPAGVAVVCLVFEMAFVFLLMWLFLRKMKKTPPLELLQEGVGFAGGHGRKAGTLPNPFGAVKPEQEIADTAPIPAGIDAAKISAASSLPAHGKYGALYQACAYILRHMRRSIGRTAVSFALTVVLAAGLGMFVLARFAYQEAYRDLRVKGTAMGFSSPNVKELSKSDLIEDIYYYNNFSVRVNGVGVLSPMTFTNDFGHYLIEDYTITYADGYGLSVFDGTGPVCLVGKALAETLGVRPGDDITLMSEGLYSFMPEVYDEEELPFAIERAGKPYKVAGILESGNEDVNAGIFAAVNDAAENLYSQPFPVGYCEFTLTDNGKVKELESLLEELKNNSIRYSPLASFHVDSETLETVKRIRNLLESLFPVAVAAAVLIGLFGAGLVIMQSAQEAAFLRIFGVTKKRTRCMFVFEQIVLCIAGIVFVAGILTLLAPGRFGRSMEELALCWLLYFLGCVCGALAAAVQVTRHKALELLQVKE